MSDVEAPIQAPSFVPTLDVPATGEDALADLQIALETFPSQVDLVVTADEQLPVGKGWAFDWGQRQFISAARQRGPRPTYGFETLSQWIEKCLRTARGAHPIHPAGYGLAATSSPLVGGNAMQTPPDLEDRVREALTFHPKIIDVTDFTYTQDPDDDALYVNFTVELNDSELLDVQGVRINNPF